MQKRFTHSFLVLLGLVLAFGAGAAWNEPPADPIPSAVVSEQQAQAETFDWGTLYTYYTGETHGTEDVLAGVAVIKPGQQIHPPHQHAEEEYLMVTEGEGTWHLNGKTFVARAGDMLYAAPWDVHGIKNTGATPLRFVVWKWGNKGVPPVPAPK